MEEFAVKVGYVFGIFTKNELVKNNVVITNTGIKVALNNIEYDLHAGATFEDSTKIDRLLDLSQEYKLSDYKI